MPNLSRLFVFEFKIPAQPGMPRHSLLRSGGCTNPPHHPPFDGFSLPMPRRALRWPPCSTRKRSSLSGKLTTPYASAGFRPALCIRLSIHRPMCTLVASSVPYASAHHNTTQRIRHNAHTTGTRPLLFLCGAYAGNATRELMRCSRHCTYSTHPDPSQPSFPTPALLNIM
jgi:hypothetical protein